VGGWWVVSLCTHVGSVSTSFLRIVWRVCGTSLLPSESTSCLTTAPKKLVEDHHTFPYKCTTGSWVPRPKQSHRRRAHRQTALGQLIGPRKPVIRQGGPTV
jgi:hypothetical protein